MKRFVAILFIMMLSFSSSLSETRPDYPLLSVGSGGKEVVVLQQRLVAAGFLTGQVDGRYGEGTRKAVAAVQQALNQRGYQLKVDGIAGQQTLSLLYDDQVMAPFIDFSLGTTGQRVVSLQTRLIDLKFLDGTADGVFGQKTLDALKAFQTLLHQQGAGGILVNGLADEATRGWLKLDADLSGFGIRAPEFFDDADPKSLSGEFLNAKASVLVNARTGEILFSKNLDERLYPASTTKMMTLLLAVECGRLDEMVVLPASTGEVAKDSSLVPVYPGERMSMRDLLYGLMLRSGNDAANAVAELCAGSVGQFVTQMNERARQLGMNGTQFTNPHGYHDPEHYSTARDLAVLALHAMANPVFREVASTLEYDLQPTSKRGVLHISNTSELLKPSSPFYFEGAAGIKSGYTSAAGFCYAGTAQKGEAHMVAVILGSRTRNRAWNDMARLFRYGFAVLNVR
jgi:D-alanyl-D-alanine carboxypeptidase